MSETATIVNGHRIHFPAVRDWTELIETYTLDVIQRPGAVRIHFTERKYRNNKPYNAKVYCEIDDWMSVRTRQYDFGSCYVKLRADVVNHIRNNMLWVEYDTFTLKVIEWSDGRALVTCDHNKIIGGIWLAIIDASTIPGEFREKR